MIWKWKLQWDLKKISFSNPVLSRNNEEKKISTMTLVCGFIQYRTTWKQLYFKLLIYLIPKRKKRKRIFSKNNSSLIYFGEYENEDIDYLEYSLNILSVPFTEWWQIDFFFCFVFVPSGSQFIRSKVHIYIMNPYSHIFFLSLSIKSITIFFLLCYFSFG